MKNIPLLLMGCGGVGRQLLQHIVNTRSLHAKQGLLLRVVGVCDSQTLVQAVDIFTMGLDDTILTEICKMKSSGSTLTKMSNFGKCQLFENIDATSAIVDVAGLLGRSTGLVLVDCSASSVTVGVLNQAVDAGCCIVLANKKPLTSKIEDYEKLVANSRRIRYESTVGAGLPVITSLTRIIESGDPIHRIVGTLSGTLGYVMSELQDGRPFSDVVRGAKSLGYTEPDPRDDLGGMDVARKALILARLLGWKINLDDIKVESLYPDEMGPNWITVEEFLDRGLQSLDKDVADRVRNASCDGKVLRYVCIIEGSRCQVGLQELPKDSPLGRLRGSDNVSTICKGHPRSLKISQKGRTMCSVLLYLKRLYWFLLGVVVLIDCSTMEGTYKHHRSAARALHSIYVEVYSRCYKELPLVIQGAGAGNDTTAAGVLADIVDLQDHFR